MKKNENNIQEELSEQDEQLQSFLAVVYRIATRLAEEKVNLNDFDWNCPSRYTEKAEDKTRITSN